MHTVFQNTDLKKIDFAKDVVDIFVEDCYLDFELLWQKARQFPNTKFNITWHHVYYGETPDNVKIVCDITKHKSIYKYYNKLKSNSFEKNIKHTVSTFNGSTHPTRTILCILLLKHDLWRNKFCKKAFTENLGVISRILSVEDQKKFAHGLTQKQIKTFLRTSNSIDYNQNTRHQPDTNFAILKPLMDQTLINISTPAPNGGKYDTPCPDEKLILPIAAKSIWISFACSGYHQHVKQFYGFKLFENIFDYAFDNVSDVYTRLEKMMSQIVDIHKLPNKQKQQLHDENLDIIEYNYNHLVSGSWIDHFHNAYKKYSLTNSTQNHIIKK